MRSKALHMTQLMVGRTVLPSARFAKKAPPSPADGKTVRLTLCIVMFLALRATVAALQQATVYRRTNFTGNYSPRR